MRPLPVQAVAVLAVLAVLAVVRRAAAAPHAAAAAPDLHTTVLSRSPIVQRVADALGAPYAPAAPGNSIRVTDYGADPTGVKDSTAAIQAAINASWTRGQGWRADANCVDMGNLQVDFQGGHYLVSQPLFFPAVAGCNVAFVNGELLAGDGFPSDGFLLQVDRLNDPADRMLRYRYVSFVRMEFDGRHRIAGLVKAMQTEQWRFSLCRFVGFTCVL